MAKVKGPFMSVTASGTVAGLLTAKYSKDGAQIMNKPHPRAKPSKQQLKERQTMRDARAAFMQLDTSDKNEWNQLGIDRGNNGWMQFFREWKIQQIKTGQTPLIPEITL